MGFCESAGIPFYVKVDLGLEKAKTGGYYNGQERMQWTIFWN